jgi:hypothetical protein
MCTPRRPVFKCAQFLVFPSCHRLSFTPVQICIQNCCSAYFSVCFYLKFMILTI